MLKQETRSTGASLRLGGTPSLIPKVKNCGGTAKNMRKSSMKVSDLANVFPRTINLEVVMSLAQEIWLYYGFFRYPGIYPNRRSFRNRISPPPKKNIYIYNECNANNSPVRKITPIHPTDCLKYILNVSTVLQPKIVVMFVSLLISAVCDGSPLPFLND